MTFSDILLKSFYENLKKLTEITKIIHFSILLHFKILKFLILLYLSSFPSKKKNIFYDFF